MAGTWIRLAHVALSSTGDTIDSGTFTAKKNLRVKAYTKGANTELQFRFNSDSGSNYASRRSGDGGSDSTFTSQTQSKVNATGGASTTETYMTADITNISDKEKLVISHQVASEATGAGTAPRRSEGVTKWANTSAQITSIQIINNASGDFAAGSYITVFGASADTVTDEKTTLTNVPTNTRYEETDTRKIYRRAIPSSPQATKTFTFGSSQVPAGSNVSLTIADSGTKMYLASNSSSDSQAGYQYTLSTAYDVSTASYASKSFNSWGSADIRGMKVKNNGQYFYRMSDQTGNKTVRRFTASTAYDISTLGSGQSYTYDGVQTGGKDVELSDDGTKMYGLADNRTIYQYALSTAWDVTSASSASKSFSCNSQDTAGRSFMITNSGTKLRFLGQANKKIYTYTLSTAWDISTASYDGSGSDISCSFTNNPYGLGGKDDGTWFAVAETDSPYEVQQFDKDPVWKERGTA